MGFSIPRNKATWKEQKRQTAKQQRHLLDKLRGTELVPKARKPKKKKKPTPSWNSNNVYIIGGTIMGDVFTFGGLLQNASEDDVGNRRVFETTEFKYQTISYIEAPPAKVFKAVHTYRLTCTKGADELVWSGLCVRSGGVVRFVNNPIPQPILHADWLHGLPVGAAARRREAYLQEVAPPCIALWDGPVESSAYHCDRPLGKLTHYSANFIRQGRERLYCAVEIRGHSSGQRCSCKWQMQPDSEWWPENFSNAIGWREYTIHPDGSAELVRVHTR